MLKNRKYHLEFIRIIACFFVLYNHTSASLIGRVEWNFHKSEVASLILYYLCKTAVPLFLMIAGANLLPKRDTKIVYGRRIAKCIMVIVAFSLGYYVFYNSELMWRDFFKIVIGQHVTLAFWYLYLYLGILLMLPILRSLEMETKQYIYLIALYTMISGSFPFLNYYFGGFILEENISRAMFSSYIILFLMGDFLENKLAERWYQRKYAVAVWGLLTALVVFSFGCTYYQWKTTNIVEMNYVYNNQYYFTTVWISIFIFYLVHYYRNIKLPDVVKSMICVVGKCTLGIFLLGDFLRLHFVKILDYMKENYSEFLAVVVYDIIIFVIGLGITLAVQWIKKIVGQLAKID